MEEFQGGDDPDVYDEAAPEEDELLDEEEELDLTEQQRAEAADLSKLFRQHPEIWIPYSEEVQQQLQTHPPSESEGKESELQKVTLRETNHIDPNHCTYPFLTNYERTKCISFRASQIANGAKPYTMIPPGMTDSYEIAKLELEQRRLPFIIKRPIPDGSFEVWKLSDLMIV